MENCGDLFNVSSDTDNRIFLDRTIPRICFQCVDDDGMVITNAEWIISIAGMRPVVVSSNVNEIPDDTEYINGKVVVFNLSEFIIDGLNGNNFDLQCVDVSERIAISSICKSYLSKV